MFAGCGRVSDDPFTVYNVKTKTQISIGDKREDIEKVIGGFEYLVIEFDDENEKRLSERVTYSEDEDISFDYGKDGSTVLGIRISGPDWKIGNGLKVTNSGEDVKRNYDKEYIYNYKKSEDMYLSYNENGELITFSEDAPYILRFAIEDYAIDRIIIDDYRMGR